jgi:tetratricopeptide (TPR) repeat protein
MARRHLLSATAVLLGVGLMAVAVPRTNDAMARISPLATAAQLAAGEKVEPEAIDRAARRLGATLESHGEARVRGEFAYLKFEQALAAGVRDEPGRKFLDAAIAQQRDALADGPADGYGWFRLAQAVLLREGVRSKAIDYLDFSLAIYPASSGMLMDRLDLSLMMWPSLPEPTRTKVAGQIRQAAAGTYWRRRELVELIRRRFALAPVRAALADDPALAASFENFYQTWYWRESDAVSNPARN